MKYVLLAPEDKRVLHISNDLAYQDNGNYLVDNGTLAIPQSICEMHEVGSLPANVEPEKWCYINGQFAPNPNWREPDGPVDVGRVFAIMRGEIE